MNRRELILLWEKDGAKKSKILNTILLIGLILFFLGGGIFTGLYLVKLPSEELLDHYEEVAWNAIEQVVEMQSSYSKKITIKSNEIGHYGKVTAIYEDGEIRVIRDYERDQFIGACICMALISATCFMILIVIINTINFQFFKKKIEKKQISNTFR